MIALDSKEETASNKFNKFDEVLSDGRMTEPSDGKIYRLREAILLSKQLGRPLSADEMKQFEV